jgi:hypothetical protein
MAAIVSLQSHTVRIRGKISKSKLNAIERCPHMLYNKLSTLVAIMFSVGSKFSKPLYGAAFASNTDKNAPYLQITSLLVQTNNGQSVSGWQISSDGQTFLIVQTPSDGRSGFTLSLFDTNTRQLHPFWSESENYLVAFARHLIENRHLAARFQRGVRFLQQLVVGLQVVMAQQVREQDLVSYYSTTLCFFVR